MTKDSTFANQTLTADPVERSFAQDLNPKRQRVLRRVKKRMAP
jgi:hypothetical protein